MAARLFRYIFLMAFCLLWQVGSARAIPAAMHEQLAGMLKHVTPTVVNITVIHKKDPSTITHDLDSSKTPQGNTEVTLGSGVIFNAKQGLIITNAHVINKPHLIIVQLKNGRRYIAKTIGKDDGFDIGVIKIAAKNLKALPFADSNKLKVGNFVTAIGSPFGLQQTVTSGVISALNVNQPKIEGFQSFIQTDAAINPGNSGGALVNLQGQLVGINTAILGPGANIGIGFAIPSNMTKSVAEQLVKYGHVKRGMLGVLAENISAELASALNLKQHQGALVSQIIPGSPAQKSGLKVKDVITKLNNKPVYSAVQLRNSLGLMRPGSALRITVIRHGQSKTLLAKVSSPGASLLQPTIPFLAGLKLQKFNELEGNGNTIKGALVADISLSSQAALAGIVPGDVITQANGVTISSPKDLEKIAMTRPQQLLVSVSRGGHSAFLVIESAAS